MKSAPFSELENGLPLWRLQVDDPQAAMDAPLNLYLRVLDLPQGGVAAAVLELSDIKGSRPSYHHVCESWAHPDLQAWFAALKAQGKVRLRFERAGWMSDAHREVAMEPGVLAALGTPLGTAGGEADAAVREYAAFYREQFPKLKSPLAVWEACLEQARRPAAAESKAWIKWALVGALAVGAALAAWLAL